MAILALTQNNKNQFRKYPLKQGSTAKAVDGFVLADNLIVNCSITSVYGKHRIFIKQISYLGEILRVVIASVTDGKVLGAFTGGVNEDYTVLPLDSYERNVDGTLTIGSVSSLQDISRVLTFDSESTELEESTIFCYIPPAVASIQDNKHTEARGHVGFKLLINLVKEQVTGSNTINFSVINPGSVFNLADTSTALGNCPNPVILSINNVEPYPISGAAANDGNIYLFGVKPIVFYGVPEGGGGTEAGSIVIDTTSDPEYSLDIDSLCTARNKILPPVGTSTFLLPLTPPATIDDPDSVSSDEFINKYYTKSGLFDGTGVVGNFNTAKLPEYYYWPQFRPSDEE